MKIIQYRGALSPAAAQAELDSVYQSLAIDAYGPFSLYRTPAPCSGIQPPTNLKVAATKAVSTPPSVAEQQVGPASSALGCGAPVALGVDSLDPVQPGQREHEEPSRSDAGART